MAGITEGTECIKITGRKAGKKVVVLKIENGFALVEGPNIKKKRCNLRHLIPVKAKESLKEEKKTSRKRK